MKDRDSQMNGFHLWSYGKANITSTVITLGSLSNLSQVLLNNHNKLIGSPGELQWTHSLSVGPYKQEIDLFYIFLCNQFLESPNSFWANLINPSSACPSYFSNDMWFALISSEVSPQVKMIFLYLPQRRISWEDSLKWSWSSIGSFFNLDVHGG